MKRNKIRVLNNKNHFNKGGNDMKRVQLYTSPSGKELFKARETFYAWDEKGTDAVIPFTVCTEHTVIDSESNAIHVNNLNSVKFV